MADNEKKAEPSLLGMIAGQIPMLARGAVGVALRAVASKPDAVSLLAKDAYDDEFDGEPEVSWEKLPAKEKKRYRGYARAVLVGLDRVAKAATIGG